MKIIGSLLDAKRECANELFNSYGKQDTGYETVCRLSTKIKYLDKAIHARTQDYEEMMNTSPVFKKYMKGQSRKHSHYEVTANQIAGIIIGWCLVYFMFPLMGLEPTPLQASISSASFFVASYIRSYSIRRAFNKWVK